MNVVIDTSVLVSAVLKDRTPETVILFVIEHPDFNWVVSQAILDEYKGVLARPKFGLPSNLLQGWHTLLQEVTVVVDADLPFEFLRDAGDAKFLACAVAASATWLITGDQDFEEARKLLSTTILSVSQFKLLVCDSLS